MARDSQRRKEKATGVVVKPQVFVGLDLSLNGPAFVALSRKREMVVGWGFTTNEKKFVEMKEDPKGVLIQRHYIEARYKEGKKGWTAGEDVDNFEARRRYTIFNCVWNFIVQMAECIPGNVVVAIEDYAVGKASGKNTRSIIQLSELCGCIKNNLYHYGVPVRTYDPLKIKSWATGMNHAKKIQMVHSAMLHGFVVPPRYCENGSKFTPPVSIEGSVFTNDLKGPGTDLADAFHIACMLRMETLIREGTEKSIPLHRLRLLQNKTKAHPEPLLTRPLIRKDPTCDPTSSQK